MDSRAGRQRLRRFGNVAVVAIAVVLAPQIALAIDDPTGTITDPVNAVTGTVNDATGPGHRHHHRPGERRSPAPRTTR